MCSRVIVALSIFAILCVAFISATEAMAWQDRPLSQLPPNSDDGKAVAGTLYLSWDSQGDLWVKGPHYS